MTIPAEQPFVVGHNSQLEFLKSSYDNGHLHHAIQIIGQKGIGKETAIYQFIRWVLAKENDRQPTDDNPFNVSKECITFKQIATHVHPNLIHVCREFDEKKQKFATQIKISDVKPIHHFLHTTSGDGSWRFVVIEDADLMNRNAQNAILKLLEEPPEKTTLFLIMDSPGKLLPTIHSRCQKLAFQPLTTDELAYAIERQHDHLPDSLIDKYAQLGQGSLGDANKLIDHNFHNEWQELIMCLNDYQQGKDIAMIDYATRFEKNNDDELYQLITRFLIQSLDNMIKINAGAKNLFLHDMPDYLKSKPIGQLINIRDKVAAMLMAEKNSYLERKLVMQCVLQTLK